MEDKVFEEKLKNWKNGNTDTYEAAMGHFSQFGSWNDGEIAEEGVRLFNLMFEAEIEQYSPMSDIFTVVAAQSANGAFLAVAKMLGVSFYDLKEAAAHWYDNKDDTPQAVLTIDDIRGAAGMSHEDHKGLIRKIYGE